MSRVIYEPRCGMHIGAAAKAIAEQMLVTLVHAELGTMSLAGDREVWVEPEARTRRLGA